ncbi:MAG TPA: tyrosine-type recombinase/integrase [Devosiaceae bacterium]|jgi:integrase|nr:tyrosine-type recombinase/integrase [Devosiaceae bacterium]
MTLEIALGDGFVSFPIGEKTHTVRLSLRTRHFGEAKARQGVIVAYLEKVFAALRNDAPTTLTHKQATALAGELYRSWTDEQRRELRQTIVQTDEGWEVEDEDDGLADEAIFASVIAYLNRLKASPDENALEMELGALADRLLLQKGIVRLTAASRRMALEAFWRALKDAMERRQREAGGDYSPDPKSERFPEWTQPATVGGAAQATATAGKPAKVTISGILDGWWRESEAAGLKPSTYGSYSSTIGKLIKFLGHDDATRVTPEDVVRFKDWRLSTPHPRTGKPASPRTVKDTDLAGLKSVLGWAVRNRKLPSNPAEGITIKIGKQRTVRGKGFTPEEVKALLSGSSRLQQGDERRETYGAKRWIPWVLAYTGARVGEIAQLRKQDVQETGDHWSILITPEAGTTKNNRHRLVPLHPHLVELGFVAFASASSGEHLFLTPNKKTGDVLGPMKGVKNRVREFVRQYVDDPNVQPNHAWRHLFITRCRAAGVDQELRRMITGHSGEGVDESAYGDPAGLYREICKLPRFQVN